MITLACSGIAVFAAAIILKYHGEPRYRFSAACLSVGGWVAAASVALPEKWQCDQMNQKMKNIMATRADQVADEPQEAYLVGMTPGGIIVEVKSDGMRSGSIGSSERGTFPRWSGTGTGASRSRVFTGYGETGDGVTGSRGL